MERLLYDIHVHTSEVSSCGQVEAAEAVRLYQEAGYQGIMITDHFHRQYFESLPVKSWKERIDCYLTGYRKARETGEKLGLAVLLGIEYRNIETDNDFLIVGVTEEFLYDHPEIYLLPLKEAIDLFHANGMLVIQAHPVRFRVVRIQDGKLFKNYRTEEMFRLLREHPDIETLPYQAIDWLVGEKNAHPDPLLLKLQLCRLMCEDSLDGIEVYNGNCNWAQDPRKIQEIMEKHPSYIPVSASDFHVKDHLARGGMVFDRRITDSVQLKDQLAKKAILEWIRQPGT